MVVLMNQGSKISVQLHICLGTPPPSSTISESTQKLLAEQDIVYNGNQVRNETSILQIPPANNQAARIRTDVFSKQEFTLWDLRVVLSLGIGIF
jgi:hypothetical protein